MKAQCDRCKEIVPLEFTVEDAAIRVSCPSCKADYTVPATATRPAPSPVAAPTPTPGSAPNPAPHEMVCPKCGEGQKQAEACRRCGLIIARWKPDAPTADPVLGDAREAAASWKTVEEAWDDGARHEAFIDLCRRAGVLAFAAARYRQASSRPGSAARLTQIRVLAEQSLAAVQRTPPPARRSTSRTVVMAGIIAMLVLLLFLLLRSAFDLPRHP